MKTVVPSILIAILLIWGATVASKNRPLQNPDTGTPINNVTIVDGTQIVELNAKGGYSPRRSVAQANIPTIIRFQTSGTFDCSSSIRIPSININKILPSTGTEDIDIGSQPISVFKGSCGMGMYPFEIEFK